MNNWEVFRIGSADERDYTVIGVPSTNGVTIAEAYFAIKKSLSDPDEAALVFLTITTEATGSGVSSDNGLGDGSGVVKFVVDEAALLNADPKLTYFRSVKVRLNNGRFSAIRNGADAPVRILTSGIAKTS